MEMSRFSVFAFLTALICVIHCACAHNILMVIPFTTQSHRNCFMPLALQLAERGDKITILSSLPPKNIHASIVEYNHGIPTDDTTENHTMFHQRLEGISGQLAYFEKMLPRVAKELYDIPIVQELYRKRKEFDLIIVDELFNEMAYPFVVGQTFMFISTAGIMDYSSSFLGNPLNPAYVAFPFVQFNHPFNFWERASNLFHDIVVWGYWKHWGIVPKVEKELLKHFPDLPPLLEIEKNVSLILSNSHFSTNQVLPLLPTQVEVGGMHCRPGRKLPKDLQEFLNNGKEGVVYFSLGSIAKGTTIPEEYKKTLVESFRRLKRKVLWKFEEELENLPSNVMIKSWFPQQDVLAHPNVKLFITHGGLLSIQESIYHSTPLLALPIFGDQKSNAFRIQSKGIGRTLEWEDLTPELVVREIEEIITNQKYGKRMKEISTAFRDQPMTPVQTAVFWTDYVIRNEGAPLLRSPARNLSWIAFLYADLIIVAYLTLYLSYTLVKKLLKLCFGRDKKDKMQYSKEKKKKL